MYRSPRLAERSWRRTRPAHKAQRGTAVPTVQALIHRRTQFEGDALRNVQPVQFVVEDVRQTTVELPSTSDDSSGGVQDLLQLVSRSSRRVREQCVAVIYPTGHERVDKCSCTLAVKRTSHPTQLTQLKTLSLVADCRFMLLECRVRCKKDTKHTHSVGSIHSARSKSESGIVKAQETCDGIPDAGPHQLGLFDVEFQPVG